MCLNATRAAAAATPRALHFADFPAPPPYTGKVAPIDYDSDPDGARLRDFIDGAVSRKPNFAGHMIVANWRCGTDCEVVAFVDAHNGKISFGPVAEFGVSFRLSSRLLIVNPPATLRQAYGRDPVDEWATTRYYVWHDRGHVRQTGLTGRR